MEDDKGKEVQESETPPSFAVSLNDKLINTILKIKKERQTLRARLTKVEENKKSVSERVFKKVYNEYSELMEKATNELKKIKEEVDQEIDNISEQKMLAELALRDTKDALEEIQLRQSLGEIPEREFKMAEKEKLTTIERIKREIVLLDENTKKYESLFEDEDIFKPPPKVTVPPIETPEESEEPPAEKASEIEVPEEKEEVKPKQPKKSGKPVIDESDYIYLPEDIGQFEEAPADDSPLSEGVEPQIVVMEKGEVKQETNLSGGTLFIGRSPSNQVVVPDPKVSRKHAAIDFKNDQYVVCDLGSSNGTYVGGKKIKEHILQSGDEIKVGSYTIVFKS